jgi:hypothetical protein
MTAFSPVRADLDATRAIVLDRINDAMVEAQRSAQSDVAIPNSLRSACMWLADQAEFPASEGEEYFGWTPAVCLRFLYGLSPQARAEEVAGGYAVLFVGNSRRAPLVDMGLTSCGGDPRSIAA